VSGTRLLQRGVESLVPWSSPGSERSQLRASPIEIVVATTGPRSICAGPDGSRIPCAGECDRRRQAHRSGSCRVLIRSAAGRSGSVCRLHYLGHHGGASN
jgi:hypothetical protein